MGNEDRFYIENSNSRHNTIDISIRRTDFRNVYLYGDASDNDDKSTPGVYAAFSDGEIYGNSEFYATNPNALQINIGTDDFTIVNPLNPSAANHSVNGTYFIIRNLHHKYSSRTNNVFLISLCFSDDLKTKETDFNDIWKMIVHEIKILENDGIIIGDGIKIKGSLSYLSYDNLGGNVAFGMAKGFNTHFYCRICMCHIDECKHLTEDVADKIRTPELYDTQLEVNSNAQKVIYKETGGIERYCHLNDLKYYHIFKNVSVDLMHDIFEGIIPFLLSHLVEYCKNEKIVNETNLAKKIQSFDYGVLNKAKTPALC